VHINVNAPSTAIFHCYNAGHTRLLFYPNPKTESFKLQIKQQLVPKHPGFFIWSHIGMNRKLVIAATLVAGAQIFVVLTLGMASRGQLLSNALQLSAAAIAAIMCFFAARRGKGLSRSFWVFVGLAFVSWCFANLGWMYYENWLGINVPTPSGVRFLFEVQGIFFAISLFLNEEKNQFEFDLETGLDLIQIAIIFFLVFLGLYYIPALHAPPTHEDFILSSEELGEYLALIGLALLRRHRARSSELRKLYRGMIQYLCFYTFAWLIAQYGQTLHGLPAGTWYDLCWTLPFLSAAFWAANWTAANKETPIAPRVKTLAWLVITNASLALAPLFALVGFAILGAEWQTLASLMLGCSILCYGARLALTEYRQSRGAETVRRQTLAMDSSMEGIAIMNSNGEYIYVNFAFATMIGFQNPDALIGMNWRNVFNPQEVDRLSTAIRQAMQTTGTWSGETMVLRPSGETFPMEVAITALPEGGTVTVSRDVTERRREEKARLETEAKYRLLVEQVAAITYIAELGVQGRWHYVSPQVEQILGFTEDEWLANSTSWMANIPLEDHHIVEAAESAAIRGGRFQAEYRLIRKDGKVIWVSDTAVIVRGSDAHPVMEGIIVDITERKLLETQLQQSRKMEAVGRLAGGIAHDFNNLLTIIKGYTELALNRSAAYPEIRSDIERIENASERAAALVRQLLAFSRKQVLQPKTLDLNSIALNLDKLLRRLMDENIEMITRVDENLGAIKADPAQIEQVIMNLVVNARDAMPKGGRLTLETANVELDSLYAADHVSVRPGRYVMLAVSDTGTGMDRDTVAHIFEPFYTTKESGRGTGLGLSTVYGIVKQSGGYIWVYSEPGRGSTFKVYLPRVDEVVPGPRGEKQITDSRRGTETILLVEDEDGVRELAKTVLTAQGYQVLVTGRPDEAIAMLRDHKQEIQLLLTDVIMPNMSGRELARRVSAVRPDIKVLFMSGYTDNVISAGGMLEEGISFLQKPFTPTVLLQKIREVLNQAAPV
jgi:PAS domain S-box-containing protein